MKVIYDKRFEIEYAEDPAAEQGRMNSIYEALKNKYEFVKPELATEEDLALIHTKEHIEKMKTLRLYPIALLAVGGAIKAAELAWAGEPAFAAIRPPGHHAGKDFNWGFCYFNNIAISVEKMRKQNKVKKVVIVDFDLHYGAGTSNIFMKNPDIIYYHLFRGKKRQQLYELTKNLKKINNCDIVAVSAGFDSHREDWGKWLLTEDYTEIGMIVKEFSERVCQGKRYAVLEGGYNKSILGKNVDAFLEGLK